MRAGPSSSSGASAQRLLVVVSLMTVGAASLVGLVLLAVGAPTVGLVALGVGLPALLPVALLRAGLPLRVATRAFFGAGLLALSATAWASGGALSPLWPAFLVLPSLLALLADAGGLLPWVATAAALPLAVWGADLMGWAPPSFVPPAWTQPLTLLLTVLSVAFSWFAARIFELDHLRTSNRLLRAQRSIVELLSSLGGAGEDLRRAAHTLSAPPTQAGLGPVEAGPPEAGPGEPGSGASSSAETATGGPSGREGQAAASLVEAMRVESARGRALVAQATGTVERFVRSQDRIAGGFAALSTRLDEVGAVAEALGRLATRLESMALGFQIEAAGVGDEGLRFATVGTGMGRLAASVTADAREIRATLATLAEAAEAALARADEASAATAEALARLDTLSASFERVCALVERAASAGDQVVSAALGHLDLLATELRHASAHQETTTPAEAKRRAIARNLPLLIAMASGTSLAAAGALAVLGLRAIPAFLVALGVLAALPVALPRLRGRVRLGGHVFLLSTGVLVMGGAALSGGLSSPVAPALVLMPLAATFFFDRRAGLAWAVASAAAALALFAAARGGLLPPLGVSPLVEQTLHATLESVFILLAFGYSTWLAQLLGAHAGALEASERQVRAALDQVEEGGGALAEATAGLTGDGLGAGSLVDELEREARGVDARTADTRAAFRALVQHTVDIAQAGEDARARAEALGALLVRVGEISVELDLLAIQTAIEAVHVGAEAAGFQVLSREATRLAAAVKADVGGMQRGLQLARDGVRAARDGAREAAADTRQAAEAVDDLTRAFDTVYGLAARGAHAGRALAERSHRHLETLRRGLLDTTAPAAEEGASS